MSNIGQAAFTIVGYAIEAYTGYPVGPLFAAAGQALFPTKVKAPALGDLSTTTSAAGAPIPILWGMPKPIAGNIIWSAKPITRDVKERAGKSKVISQARFMSFAMALCEGPIAGVTRIWANGKIVYDARPEATQESRIASAKFAGFFTFYTGSDSQLPDPTMEAYEGVGNVPAHRGLCHIVFNELPLREYGEQLPNLTFELSENGVSQDLTTYYTSNDVLFPWDLASNDPRSCGNAYEYAYDGTWYPSLSDAASAFETDTGKPLGALLEYYIWNTDEPRPYIPMTEPEPLALNLKFSAYAPIINDLQDTAASPTWTFFWDNREPGDVSLAKAPSFGTQLWVMTEGIIDPDTFPNYDLFSDPPSGGSRRSGQDGYDFDPERWLSHSAPGTIGVRRVVQAPADPCAPFCEPAYQDLPEDAGYCVIGSSIQSHITWAKVTGTFKALAKYQESVPGSGATVVSYPLDPVLESGESDDTQAFWDAAYADAVANGDLPPGMTYQANGLGGLTTYPRVQSYRWEGSAPASAFTQSTTTVGTIVEALCRRAGLVTGEFDVSNLTEVVNGYIVSQSMSAREGIAPLQSFSFFDAVESSGQIIFPLRNRAPDFTLTVDQLGTKESNGEAPSIMKVLRVPDEELIKTARVHHNQIGLNTPGQQSYTRQLTQSTNLADINLAITMLSTKAAQIAEVLCNEAWTGRQTTEFVCSASMLDVLPGSVGIVPSSPNTSIVIRITERTYQAPSLIQYKAVLHNQDDYTSDAVGGTQPIYNASSVPLAGPTNLILIDGPALSADSDDAGVFAAMGKVLSDWTAATLMRSDDGGLTFATVDSVTTSATVGSVADAVPDGPTDTWDYGTTIRVVLDGAGTLEGAADASVLAGANAGFLGASGRWEVFQWKVATLVAERTYDLSVLLRGRKGTEWATGLHEAGDTFVLIGAGLLRVVLPPSAIGRTQTFRAVTDGNDLSASADVTIVPAGVALEPYSVVHIAGEVRDDLGGIDVSWIRRTRIDGDFLVSPVPLNEESESYDYEAAVDGAVVQSGTVTSPAVTVPVVLELTLITALSDDPMKFLDIGDGFLYGLVSDGSNSAQIRRYDRTTWAYDAGVNVGATDGYNTTAFFYYSGAFYTTRITAGASNSGLVRTPVTLFTGGGSQTVYASDIGAAQGAAQAGSSIYFSHALSSVNSVAELNPTTLALTGGFEVSDFLGAGWNSGVIDSDGAYLYVAATDGVGFRITKFDPSGALMWSSPLPTVAYEVRWLGDRVFVNCSGQSSVLVFNDFDGSLAGTIAGTITPSLYDQKMQAAGDLLVIPTAVTGTSQTSSYINPATLETVRSVTLADPRLFFSGEFPEGTVFSDGEPAGTANAYTVSRKDVTVTVWQNSAIVGRGYPSVETI